MPMTEVMRLAAPAKAVIFSVSSGKTATIEPTEAAIILAEPMPPPIASA